MPPLKIFKCKHLFSPLITLGGPSYSEHLSADISKHIKLCIIVLNTVYHNLFPSVPAEMCSGRELVMMDAMPLLISWDGE